MKVLPDLIYSLDEPIGDPIIAAMNVLAKEASKSVKVVMTGDGADELLGGYMYHRKIMQMHLLRRIFPKFYISRSC